jgi:CheY-like chemotaxis protein
MPYKSDAAEMPLVTFEFEGEAIVRASSALRDALLAAASDEPTDGREDMPVLERELESWFSPTRPRTVFRGPHDTTRVLLVEQDPLHRRIVRVVLSGPRISLIEVTGGQAALDLLAIKRFDLVIIGGLQSVMTPEETVRWIRSSLQLWSDVAIMMLLEEGDTHTAQRLLSTGANDWARYPVQRDELVAKLIALMPALHDAGL